MAELRLKVLQGERNTNKANNNNNKEHIMSERYSRTWHGAGAVCGLAAAAGALKRIKWGKLKLPGERASYCGALWLSGRLMIVM